MTRALLAIDVQEDFCEGGSLAVAGGRPAAAGIAELLPSYDLAVASQDWHIDPGTHFAQDPDYRQTWPAHCVVGTSGAAMQSPLTETLFAGVVRKGEYTAAYSAFDGAVVGVPLAQWLRERGVDELDVCGIATDYCVLASVLDARAAGFVVRVLQGLCAGVAPDSTARALSQMADAGAELV